MAKKTELQIASLETDLSKLTLERGRWARKNLTLPIRKALKEKYDALQSETCLGFGKALQEAVEKMIEQMPDVDPKRSA